MRLILLAICGPALLSYLITGGPIHYARLYQNLREERVNPVLSKPERALGYALLLLPLLLVFGFAWSVIMFVTG